MFRSIQANAVAGILISLISLDLLTIAAAAQDRGYSAPRLDAWRILGPGGGGVIYAGAGVLWRSADRGRTWNLVYPPPSS